MKATICCKFSSGKSELCEYTYVLLLLGNIITVCSENEVKSERSFLCTSITASLRSQYRLEVEPGGKQLGVTVRVNPHGVGLAADVPPFPSVGNVLKCVNLSWSQFVDCI